MKGLEYLTDTAFTIHANRLTAYMLTKRGRYSRLPLAKSVQEFVELACNEGQSVLGLDYGGQRIGLAVSDVHLQKATPLATVRLSRKTVQPAKVILPPVDCQVLGEALRTAQTKNGLHKLLIVVGYPVNHHGEEGPMCELILRFLHHAQYSTHAPILWDRILLWNERHSTTAAYEALYEQEVSLCIHKTFAKRKKIIDREAAACILQDFLDTVRNETWHVKDITK